MQKADARTTDVYARTSLRLRRALGIVGVSFASLGSGPCGGPCTASEVCYLRKDLEAFRAQYLAAGCNNGIASGVAGGAGAPATSAQPSCFDADFKAIQDWDPSAGCPDQTQMRALDYEYSQANDDELPTAPKKTNLTCCKTVHENCGEGRPFIVDGQARLPALKGNLSTAGGTPLAAALAGVWADDGRAEYASIASFARLTLQLMAFGAPHRLIEASQQASLDEHRHSRFCFAEAARHAGRGVEPGPLDIGQASALTSFEEFMRLNLIEGCVGETLAGLRMAEQARLASNPELARALTEISEDETRHAELAFEILRFGLEVNRRATLAAVRSVLEMRFEDEAADPQGSIPEAAWEALGRLSAKTRRQVNRDAWTLVVAPLLRGLLHDDWLQRTPSELMPAREIGC